MINFNYEVDFELKNKEKLSDWISELIISEGFTEGELNYTFCNDKGLLVLNKKYLNHNTLTDVITFDYTIGKQMHGDIFISTDRVAENAEIYRVSFSEELRRVMAHGILHICGYKDKLEEDIKVMRDKEEYYLNKFKDFK